MQIDFYTVAAHVARVFRAGETYTPGPEELAVLRAGLTRALLDRDAFGALVDPLVADRALVLADITALPQDVLDAILDAGFDGVGEPDILLIVRSPAALFALWDAMEVPTRYWLDRAKNTLPAPPPFIAPWPAPATVASTLIVPDGRVGGHGKYGTARVLAVAVCLILVAGVSLSYATQDGQGARLRSEEAKQTMGRLNVELRQRSTTSLKLIAPNPENLTDEQVVTRATLVHQWFCDRERIEEKALSLVYFFNSCPEYKSWSACQLLAKLQDHLRHSNDFNPEVRKKHHRDAEKARALLTRFDEVALKHFGFVGKEGALAFEEDMRRLYTDVIAFLDEQK